MEQIPAEIIAHSSRDFHHPSGYLSLRHHGLHHISDKTIAAMTTAHSFFDQDSQEKTLAEGPFGTNSTLAILVVFGVTAALHWQREHTK